MGKAKKFMDGHNEAVVKLTMLLNEAFNLYKSSTISLAEFVGNLEATKHLAFVEMDEATDDCDLDAALGDLLETIFGDEEEEE